MAKSTDIKVKLSSVDEVKQFVDVMRGYHGDVSYKQKLYGRCKIYSWCYQSRSER